jgi:hypothetical protein
MKAPFEQKTEPLSLEGEGGKTSWRNAGCRAIIEMNPVLMEAQMPWFPEEDVLPFSGCRRQTE